jgi:hypothetical protein
MLCEAAKQRGSQGSGVASLFCGLAPVSSAVEPLNPRPHVLGADVPRNLSGHAGR